MQPRIAICVPHHRDVRATFAFCLAALVLNVTGQEPKIIKDVTIQTASSAILPQSRELIAEKALAAGASHLFWLDDDMAFAPDMLRRLLSHGKQIVGTNARRRVPPYTFTAVSRGKIIETTALSVGLQRIGHTGLACT